MAKRPNGLGWGAWRVGILTDGKKVVLGSTGSFLLSNLTLPCATGVEGGNASAEVATPKFSVVGTALCRELRDQMPFGLWLWNLQGPWNCLFFCSQQVSKSRERISVGGFYRPVLEMALVHHCSHSIGQNSGIWWHIRAKNGGSGSVAVRPVRREHALWPLGSILLTGHVLFPSGPSQSLFLCLF